MKDFEALKVRGNLYYVRGILNRRFDNKINGMLAMDLLVKAHAGGMKIETMTAYAKSVKSWDEWLAGISENVPNGPRKKNMKKKLIIATLVAIAVGFPLAAIYTPGIWVMIAGVGLLGIHFVRGLIVASSDEADDEWSHGYRYDCSYDPNKHD